MARQGSAFTEKEIQRIITFLSSTDMTVLEIAQRMGCGRSTVASINRKFQVRDYAGLRSKWPLLPLNRVGRRDPVGSISKSQHLTSRSRFPQR